MKQSQKRQIAYKIKINDILRGEYVKEEEEWMPNYIKIDNKKVSRVNLIAVVVSKRNLENSNHYELITDDGSGKILVRSFEENNNFEGIGVGDPVLIIGRPREYLNERYIVSEILKKIDNQLWIELRKLEIENKKEEITINEIDEEEREKRNNQELNANLERDINIKIFELIKEMDKGDGADIEDVITKANIERIEEIIEGLLKEGDIFEINRGKLKVLE